VREGGPGGAVRLEVRGNRGRHASRSAAGKRSQR
jgi:hypothetical protein